MRFFSIKKVDFAVIDEFNKALNLFTVVERNKFFLLCNNSITKNHLPSSLLIKLIKHKFLSRTGELNPLVAKLALSINARAAEHHQFSITPRN